MTSPSRTIAREFVRLFVHDVVEPFEAEGLPAERWPDIVRAIERLRPCPPRSCSPSTS